MQVATAATDDLRTLEEGDLDAAQDESNDEDTGKPKETTGGTHRWH